MLRSNMLQQQDYTINAGNSIGPPVLPLPEFCDWLLPRIVDQTAESTRPPSQMQPSKGESAVAGDPLGELKCSASVDAAVSYKGGEPTLPLTPPSQPTPSGAMLNWPDQLTVNQYAPGGGIPPHVDTHSAFEHSIASISLGSDVVMEFRIKQQQQLDEKQSADSGEGRCSGHPMLKKVAVHLPRRSVLVLNGASRYKWAHSIACRKTDMIDGAVIPRGVRTSLTFRTIRSLPCECAFPDYCDHPR
jgi:alkylated DNA repair protein alkB family protein 8